MAVRHILALDIGSNSVGSMWFDTSSGAITAGTSIFPAGVDESDDKRGDPKNAKRRMTRRTRITLRRRAQRKRELRLRLIAAGLLPSTVGEFHALLEATDPWSLRREGLDKPLTPHQFGRVLLHLAQRRGALGLTVTIEENEEGESKATDDGKVKKAIGEMRLKMIEAKARTFGEFIATVRDERIHALPGPDPRPKTERVGPREYRDAIRNKAGNYEHCADRAMIRDEFDLLWKAQRKMAGPTAKLLTDALRLELDDETGDSLWKHRGLLFGQRRQTWDLGTLGRCVLEPTERCAPHADMHASRYLVVETVNNLRILERGTKRPLLREERSRIKDYLSSPLGLHTKGKHKGKPKTTVTPADLRAKMIEWYGEGKWTKAKKLSPCRFVNEDADEEKDINTDWFGREIIHGAIGADVWEKMPEPLREGINRAILRHNPEEDGDAEKLRAGVMKWAKLSEKQADAFVAAWAKRPKPDAKRLTLSRKAVRNLLTVMDRAEPWPDPKNSSSHRWLTQIEARKVLAGDGDFRDVTTGQPMDDLTRRRYATGAKGATARDRHYMGKHVLTRNGEAVIGPDGHPLAEPPPAPMIANPVVRKAIHEVRRHLVEYMTTFGRKPDAICIELAREAKMGKMDSDRALFINRLRDRIKKEIVETFELGGMSATQQSAAVVRVVLCMQQGGESARCPLCGKPGLTPRMAARGEGCEVAHIFPKGQGGHNGLTNVVLAHTKCNRDMGRRTPRAFWSATLPGGFDEGLAWVKSIYESIDRIKPSAAKDTEGLELWKCYTSEQARPKKGSLSDKPPNYFSRRPDWAKVEQFEREKPPPDMTDRQAAATKYATRQVMTYLADAVFGGNGLPERALGSGNPEDERRIFATDGLWTSRLRREWGLFFDPHHARAKGLGVDEEHQRKEKNRGDHRHHAIDAIVIGLCTRQVQLAWEARERAADAAGINTADEEQMDNYRRLHPLDPPAPFKTREAFREAVQKAVFGDEENPRPICHRPVKRKLVGALHEETLFGPVLDQDGNLTDNFTARKNILALDANHLRLPRAETEKEAIARLAARRMLSKSGLEERNARKWASQVVKSAGYLAKVVDPPPGLPGIVRDVALRARLRACLAQAGLDPDKFTANDVKKIANAGGFTQASGVPIKSFVLLRTMSDPVVVKRRRPDYSTMLMNDDDDTASLRAYKSGSNHHVEVRESASGKLTGTIVTGFEAAQRKLRKLRAFREAQIPRPKQFRELPAAERGRLTPVLRSIEAAHPIVDRSDRDDLGGRFIMSLCEGETLLMKHKNTGTVDYYVVAKMSEVGGIVMVPHWDARSAGKRKDSSGRVIPDSSREQFSVTPSDLATLAPPGQPHARKVRVSPLGVVTLLEKD